MKIKKILAGALAAVVAVGTLSISTSAYEYERFTEGDFTYMELPNGTLEITGYCGSGGTVVIPEEANGKKVSLIEGLDDNGPYPSSAVLITSVEIPNGIKCSYNPFRFCTSLTSIIVKDDNPDYTIVDGVLFNKDITKILCYPIGKSGTKYEIPDTVTEIEYYAFANCTSLSSIKIPDSVTKIRGFAFYCCTSLTSIDIPDSVTYMGSEGGEGGIYPNGSFVGCSSLTAVNVDEGNPIFTSTDGVLFNKDMTIIHLYPAGKTAKEYTVPDGVTEIEWDSFNGCVFLTSVILPDGVKEIGQSAFWNCTSLASIVIPASVTYIQYSAFRYSKDFGDGVIDGLTIYGHTGSYAEEYAQEYDINFRALDEKTTISDKETNVEISSTVEALLGLKLKVDVDTEKQTDTRTDFDITLIDLSGKPAQPKGKVTVKITVPEKMEGAENCYVFRRDGEKLTDMEAEYDKESNIVTFTTDHFSTYVLSTVDLTDTSGAGSGNTPTPAPGGNTDTPTQSTTTTESTTTDPVATTTAPASTTAAPATSATTNEDTSPNTGAAILLVPALTAAAAVLISKKRK